jgi:uncharacterized protein involved in exopolysaccharide biosynthesis
MLDIQKNTTGFALSAPSHAGQAANSSEAVLTPLLLQYLQIALRWKWIIAGIIVFALAIGVVSTLLATPQYSSSARVEISRDQKQVTNVQGVESAQAGRDLEFYQTQYELLRARSLAQRVARQMRLATDEEFFAAHAVDPQASGPGA